MHRWINTTGLAYNFYLDSKRYSDVNRSLADLIQRIDELESNYYYIKQDITAGLNGGLALGNQSRYDGTNFSGAYRTILMTPAELYHIKSCVTGWRLSELNTKLKFNNKGLGLPCFYYPYNSGIDYIACDYGNSNNQITQVRYSTNDIVKTREGIYTHIDVVPMNAEIGGCLNPVFYGVMGNNMTFGPLYTNIDGTSHITRVFRLGNVSRFDSHQLAFPVASSKTRYDLTDYKIISGGLVTDGSYADININGYTKRKQVFIAGGSYTSSIGSTRESSNHKPITQTLFTKYILLNSIEFIGRSTDPYNGPGDCHFTGLANIDVPMNVIVITDPSAIVKKVYVDSVETKFYSRQAREYTQVNFEIPLVAYTNCYREVEVSVQFFSNHKVRAAIQSRGEG